MAKEAKNPPKLGFDVVDELPTRSQTRGSVWDPIIERVKTELPPGKFACIAQYDTPTDASTAATGLRNRYGSSAEVGGLEFTSRKQPTDNGQAKSGVFVSFDASKIDKKKAAEWETNRAAKMKVYREKAQARAAKAKAEKAKASK